ncbi:hypothetical protein [Nocardia salmonicida]|uniref:hypothetical protein n=1 Tax=Nocardia salmonicida TaxID=53431 RepID=UPI0033C49FF5
MSWLTRGTRFTDPAYYRDAADSSEAQLRADFAAYHQLRQIAPYGETTHEIVEHTARAHNIARQWERHSTPEHRQLWQRLTTAVQSWTTNPEAARGDFGRIQQSVIDGAADLDPETVRTQRQAAELTGHMEPVSDQSAQDGARWRPRHLSVVTNTDPGRRPDNAADRALGGRSATDLSLAEVDAIIQGTDELLDAEEAVGDLDTGADAVTALIPAGQRNAPVTYDYSESFAQHSTQLAAVRRLQDVTAEHLRLAGQFDGTTEGAEVLIARMETLMAAARDARRDASAAGAHPEEIVGAYRAGLEGRYWSQQPGAPRIAQLDQAIAERDHALVELDAMRAALGIDNNQALALAAGSENSSLSASTSLGSPPDPGGALIADAVAAAVPDTDHPAEWANPEHGGVVDAPRHEPVIDRTM